MSLTKIKYQTIVIPLGIGVTKAILGVQTDKNYGKLTGVQYISQDSAAVKGTTFQKFNIRTVELFPAGHPVTELTTGNISGPEVGPDERYHKMDMKVNQADIEITVSDGGNAGGAYTAYVILRLEDAIDPVN